MRLLEYEHAYGTRCFVSDGQELARALRAAYWALRRQTNQALVAHGVTSDQFVLLSRLADEDAITQQELARRTSSDANTIRPMLILLEKRGLITRQPHPSDGRARCVVLTAEGRRRFRAMFKDTEQCRGQLLAAVSYGDVKGLLKNLKEIAQVLQNPT